MNWLPLVISAVWATVDASNLETFQQKIIINSSELIIIPINPVLFNWDKTPGSWNEIEYSARISEYPDLPEWLSYTYESLNSIGYIYGVPPKRVSTMNLDVIAWNHYVEYEVRRLIISMDIVKRDPLEFVVELKIDNMNVKDMCNPRRMQMLLNVLRDQLGWTMIDGSPVMPAYMASAVAVGENRVPVRPNDAEGVILHLASDKDFSPDLKKLQLEVSSLWKMRPCPRDMKRTSMERHFRRQNFLMDWCAFRLRTIEHWNGEEEQEPAESDLPEEESAEINGDTELADDQKASQPLKFNHNGVPEIFEFKTEIPERGYGWAALTSCLIPGSIGGLVGFLLIALLWVDREDDGPICVRSQSEDDVSWERPSENVIIVTRPEEKDVFDEEDERNTLMHTPLPPQYGETHPNGSPALTYAV